VGHPAQPPAEEGHPEQAAQHRVQAGFEYLPRPRPWAANTPWPPPKRQRSQHVSAAFLPPGCPHGCSRSPRSQNPRGRDREAAASRAAGFRASRTARRRTRRGLTRRAGGAGVGRAGCSAGRRLLRDMSLYGSVPPAVLNPLEKPPREPTIPTPGKKIGI